MNSKKNSLLAIVLVIVLVSGITGIVSYSQRVEAERIELQKKQEQKDYQKLVIDAKDLVKKAYDTRNEKDINLAETIIKQLKEQDQKEAKAKMDKLHSFINQLKETSELLSKSEKTKNEANIQAAQKSIDAEKDAYLSKDKKAHQIRLDKLKKAIADQKAKAEKEKKAKEEKAKVEAAQTQVEVAAEAETQVSAEATASQPEVQPVGTETPTVVTPDVVPTPAAEVPQYQVPEEPQAIEQAPVQATPTSGYIDKEHTPGFRPGVDRPFNEEDVERMTRGEQEDAKSDWSAFYK
ncbi:TPA: hypothetical protein I0H43_RS03195 [Enterococcus faecalis]|nr:hypothetical protein [Enterococcus faecalis]